MPLNDLPPEILYQILGEVVAGYIERAVTSPPIDGWETLDSELHSEWFTDEEDSDDESDEYDSDVYTSEDDAEGGPGASGSGIDYGTLFDGSGSAPPTVPPALVAGDPADSSQVIVYEGEGAQEAPLTEEENNAMQIWAAEQERSFDPDNMIQFKLYLWNILELREGLPRNDVVPLLSVSHYIRDITLKVLEDAIGLERLPDGSPARSPWPLLRIIRRYYRLAHTQPFELPPPQYPARTTPLVESYYRLSGLAYSLRQMHRLIYMEPAESQEAIHDMLNLSSMADDIPQLLFRPRIEQRVHALLVHMRRYISVSMYCADITCTYKEMFSLKGTARHPGFVIHDDKIAAFSKAVEAFAQFDRKHMDKKKYPELPGPLVDLSGVVRTLGNVKKLKYVAEFRRKPQIMESTYLAIQLLEKWKRRAEFSSYILVEE